MKKIIILGSGAAPGVPSVADGFGVCNPKNKKNHRTRTSTYLDYNGVKILIDTSPDLRTQMLENNIKELDGVLYTHSHADHLHGIDDLREINRISQQSLNIYANSHTLNIIKKRFEYLLMTPGKSKDVFARPSLIGNQIKEGKPFYIMGLKITPIKLIGHIEPSIGYIFNDGEVVYIADCKALDKSIYKLIKTKVKILILPLTTINHHPFHLDMPEVIEIIEEIDPQQAIINHMSTCCDYDEINSDTKRNTFPAYDNMKVEFI